MLKITVVPSVTEAFEDDDPTVTTITRQDESGACSAIHVIDDLSAGDVLLICIAGLMNIYPEREPQGSEEESNA